MPVSGTGTRSDEIDGSGHIPPGTAVGWYVVGEHLGFGAFSDVYLSHRQRESELLALKMFKREDSQTDAGFEFGALRKIDDPHVVRVVDVQRSGDAGWYLVSEFLDGETLAQRIDTSGGSANVGEATLIGYELLDTLSIVHEHHIFHRDVKPENVILVEGRGAVLFDFGVAATRYTQRDGLTWNYWPPDVPSHVAEPDSDLFAAGIILCELLTGEHPYPRRNPHRGERPDVTRLPPGLRDVLRRAIDPNRRVRYETAEQFRDALGPFVNFDQEITVSRDDRYRTAERYAATGKLEEATNLCLPEWRSLTARIDSKRQLT